MNSSRVDARVGMNKHVHPCTLGRTPSLHLSSTFPGRTRTMAAIQYITLCPLPRLLLVPALSQEVQLGSARLGSTRPSLASLPFSPASVAPPLPSLIRLRSTSTSSRPHPQEPGFGSQLVPVLSRVCTLHRCM